MLKALDHEVTDHPRLPLRPECWIACLRSFGLGPNPYHALRRELEVTCAIGELTGQYASDFSQIKGVGRVYAVELAMVLAVFYECGPT